MAPAEGPPQQRAAHAARSSQPVVARIAVDPEDAVNAFAEFFDMFAAAPLHFCAAANRPSWRRSPASTRTVSASWSAPASVTGGWVGAVVSEYCITLLIFGARGGKP